MLFFLWVMHDFVHPPQTQPSSPCHAELHNFGSPLGLFGSRSFSAQGSSFVSLFALPLSRTIPWRRPRLCTARSPETSRMHPRRITVLESFRLHWQACRGVLLDIRRRAPLYCSDWADAFQPENFQKSVSSILYLFFRLAIYRHLKLFEFF